MAESNLVVLDVIDKLPTHKRKTYDVRELSTINKIFVHHSARLGASGVKGAYNSARYLANTRGFPGMAYHFWIPFHAMGEDVTVLHTQPLTNRTWHSGGDANTHGVSVCFQGNTNKRDLSDHQKEAFSLFLPTLMETLNVTREFVIPHNNAGMFGGRNKKLCPGKHATAFLNAWHPYC